MDGEQNEMIAIWGNNKKDRQCLLQTFSLQYGQTVRYLQTFTLRHSLDHTGQTLDTHPMTHSHLLDSLFRYISPDSHLHRLSCMTPLDLLRHSMTLMTLHKSYKLILLTRF